MTGAYRVRYDDPTGITVNPWESSLFLGRAWSYYDAPDPCCNTSGTPLAFIPAIRNDRRWRFGFIQEISWCRFEGTRQQGLAKLLAFPIVAALEYALPAKRRVLRLRAHQSADR